MQLNAGPIQLTYQNGFLRTFTAGGEEVLRMIYFALRDHHWNTAHIRITNETIDALADSFAITYDWKVDDLGIRMAGNVQIAGQSDGSITFDLYGKAVNTFLRNRVGFCVLHPIEGLAGQPCRLESPDGQTTNAVFPELISPHQPFLNLRAMTWRMTSGQQCRIRFDGDVFETEDQRNWTDASYKTYCTPLARPFPVEVSAGTEVRQRVAFKPITVLPQESVEAQTLSHFQQRLAGAESPSMRIGLGHRVDGPALSPSEADRLKPLNLSHLRTDLFFADPDWTTNLLTAQSDADQLGVPLEIALFFGADPMHEARLFLDHVQRERVLIYTLLLFDATHWTTTDNLLKLTVPLFRAHLPHVLLGGGTDANFVHLNRNRFDVEPVDFITFSITPQVHAFDDQTLMENVAAQAEVVRSAQALSAGKPVHISSVTLLPRFNPDAPAEAIRSISPADPRQTTRFGAEWTRKSLQTLMQAGAESATYYETHGPRGLLDGDVVFPVLNAFTSS